MRRRAIQPDQKQERHRAILDAADRLWLTDPQRIASVAEVAAAAGLAKGTVYLYFASKEELLLALFERKVDAYFAALLERCTAGPLDLPGLLELTRIRLVEVPGYLTLAARVLGLAERQLPAAAVSAFHQRMARHLEQAGTALLAHFPLGSPERAANLINASYALIVGLWQLRVPVQDLPELRTEPLLQAVTGDYFTTLAPALLALWRGHLLGEDPP